MDQLLKSVDKKITNFKLRITDLRVDKPVNIRVYCLPTNP